MLPLEKTAEKWSTNSSRADFDYVEGSIYAFLEGEKNFNWIKGVIAKGGGQSFLTVRSILDSLRSYGSYKRWFELSNWLDGLRKVKET